MRMVRLLIIAILKLVLLIHEIDADPLRQLASRRALQDIDLPCNTQVGALVTQTEVQAFAEVILGVIFEFFSIAEPINATLDLLLSSTTSGVTVHKVCGRCSDVEEYFGVEDSEFCSSDIYGHDALHSALVFVPVNVTGQLDVFMHLHGLIASPIEPPSSVWPESIGDILAAAATTSTTAFALNSLSSLADVWNGLIVASTGRGVAIHPDYLGYGASRFTHNRTTLPIAYAQATAVSYAAAGLYIPSNVDCNTHLARRAALAGSSEGGYAAIPSSEALADLGVEISRVTLVAAVLNLFLQLSFVSKVHWLCVNS